MSKSGADLVVSDYYSNFIEVETPPQDYHTVSKALRTLFARHGVPDVLISDNSPQFASEEFAAFARMWGFDHITSSPHYPQSRVDYNGWSLVKFRAKLTKGRTA